ncbi:alpha-L-rhamnosidase [Cnuella takakiae]|uniref:Alpha-L-rhamnosidase n=1 Tax=Cnuella takakiae TaxID=1302690 RepID=A0A1M5B577_9BACT|nr:alpha-L-rhamnosidase C-terminal domain-containing protein [Cnuella takakiae]OLY93341.1 alpha-rhamnosidase [Cnuella takakiae]SHF37663.1 alpha-L-rhamnosidase [Cnuella takakiae]
MKYLTLITLLFLSRFLCAQGLPDHLWLKPWNASWIEAQSTDPKAYGVYKFRKTFSLPNKPAKFAVHVSGDNRYKLYANGQLVSLGPARGDLYFWNFETVDLAPYLKAGNNVLAAVVWNDGPQKPEAQISYRTGFILQANDTLHAVVNTDTTWRATRDSSYAPRRVSVPGYYVAGPAEQVQMDRYISNWEQPGYSDVGWAPARNIWKGLTKGASMDARGWMLVPSPIPQMEMSTQRLAALRRSDSTTISGNFPAQKGTATIPANTSAILLLDNGTLTNAYPSLVFSGGKGASIGMAYAEGLYAKPQNATSIWAYRNKGNRNEVDGKVFVGKKDSIISSGAQGQQYTALWWRTYRYIQVEVQTKEEPLVIEDVYGTFTGYPFIKLAQVQGDDPDLPQLMDIGWRTARLCAVETYMDCPYYEQLQYIGDARIQALVTLYNTADDAMVKQALDLMDHSRIAEGITLSRYPTDLHQQIPTFSLWYIGMLHDYWRYRPDSAFVQQKLNGVRSILQFFEQYQQGDGSLKNVPYWIFTDWVPQWPRGNAPLSKSGTSSVLDMQLAWTYDVAAELEEALGAKELATRYRKRSAQLKQTVQRKYWDATRGLYADTEEKDRFSQHANTLAILSGIAPKTGMKELATRMLADTSLAAASIYFKYYLHLAGVKAGLGNRYLTWLDKWRENIRMGLTTWAEMSDVSASRSDCHAWGSSPNIELYRIVLGIDSDAPGFRRVKVEPHLGSLKEISGTMPHPAGAISAAYRQSGGTWLADIQLPKGVPGVLVWQGKRYPLKGGANKLQLPASDAAFLSQK